MAEACCRSMETYNASGKACSPNWFQAPTITRGALASWRQWEFSSQWSMYAPNGPADGGGVRVESKEGADWAVGAALAVEALLYPAAFPGPELPTGQGYKCPFTPERSTEASVLMLRTAETSLMRLYCNV